MDDKKEQNSLIKLRDLVYDTNEKSEQRTKKTSESNEKRKKKRKRETESRKCP